jgi:hypothetical protein
MVIKDCALIVLSCDKYSDLWDPYFRLFFENWKDCCFPVYLLSNNQSYDHPLVKTINVGEDRDWSSNLKNAIARLKEDYVLLLFDDAFLSEPIHTESIAKIFHWISGTQPNYVRLRAFLKPDRDVNGILGLVEKGTVYRTSIYASVWKKEILNALLIPGESAWDFEISGSIRSDSYDGFYSTWKNHIPCIHGVIKGKWDRSALRKIRAIGMSIDLNQREVMAAREAFVLWLRIQRWQLLTLIPSKYRRRIREAFYLNKRGW